MKIACILNTYPQPSHSFIRREVQALERQGFTVTRLAMRRSDVPLVDAGDRAEAAQTEYVLDAGAAGLLAAVLRIALATPVRFAGAIGLTWQLARAAPHGRWRHLVYLAEACVVVRRAAAAGAVHLHAHFGTNAATVAMLARALNGPPFSFTVHGPEEFDAPVALSLGAKAEAAAFCVAISRFGRAQLCRWTGAAHWDRIKVVHCGIEPGLFGDPAPLPKGGPHLVAVGRFVEQKGHLSLIEALGRLRQSLPDLRLVLVGDGPLRPAVAAAIAAQGLDANVTLTGWLDEAGVRDAVASAQALVMPSFAEGLPMVVMEAMAAARPVLATAIAGIPELVLPGETGWLVPAGDEEALARAVAELAATPVERLAAMGLAGRARVLVRHDADSEAASLATHFRAVSGP